MLTDTGRGRPRHDALTQSLEREAVTLCDPCREQALRATSLLQDHGHQSSTARQRQASDEQGQRRPAATPVLRVVRGVHWPTVTLGTALDRRSGAASPTIVEVVAVAGIAPHSRTSEALQDSHRPASPAGSSARPASLRARVGVSQGRNCGAE